MTRSASMPFLPNSLLRSIFSPVGKLGSGPQKQLGGLYAGKQLDGRSVLAGHLAQVGRLADALAILEPLWAQIEGQTDAFIFHALRAEICGLIGRVDEAIDQIHFMWRANPAPVYIPSVIQGELESVVIRRTEPMILQLDGGYDRSVTRRTG